MGYSHIVSNNYVSVMNLDTGEVTKFMASDPQFAKAVGLVKEGKYGEVVKLTVKGQVEKMAKLPLVVGTNFKVKIEDGVVKYSYKGSAFIVLHNALTDRMIKMAAEGFNMVPMLKFLGNLLENPSKTAVDELYLFLETTNLPITDDGCFIAYKIVAEDYTSFHDHSFKNIPSTVVEMPRNTVDENRHNTCSYGLHFCSKGYLSSYGSGPGARLLLVKVNPADVVAIPADYNNAKGRACKYLIWKDISESGWRAKYGVVDYNNSSVERGFDESDDYEAGDEDRGGEVSNELVNPPTASSISWPFPIGVEPKESVEEHNAFVKAVKAQNERNAVCPHCGYSVYQKKGYTFDGRQRYRCKECGRYWAQYGSFPAVKKFC